MLPRGRQAYLYLGLLNWEEKDNSLQKCVSQLPTCVLSHLNKPQAKFMAHFVVSTFICQVISSKIGAFLYRVAGSSFFKWKKYSSANCTNKQPTNISLFARFITIARGINYYSNPLRTVLLVI